MNDSRIVELNDKMTVSAAFVEAIAEVRAAKPERAKRNEEKAVSAAEERRRAEAEKAESEEYRRTHPLTEDEKAKNKAGYRALLKEMCGLDLDK